MPVLSLTLQPGKAEFRGKCTIHGSQTNIKLNISLSETWNRAESRKNWLGKTEMIGGLPAEKNEKNRQTLKKYR